MQLSWFTEQPMSTYPADEALRRQPDDHPARRAGDSILLFSNKYFDPVEGSRLYRERLAENVYAEECGFDAIMVNEHHNGAFCMNARCNISTAALVTATDRVKVLQLGNPLPLWANPVQLAEELAMLDMMSGGRLVTGIVRGGGQEQLANNVNPAYNREMFDEAHNLLIKIWTEPGPFSWDGDHYQFRVVNPWALPLQQPHPRIFVPGVVSKETVVWAAEHGYPYVALGTTIPQTKQIWQIYDSTAATAGFTAGSEHRGYLLRCHVNSDHDTAIRNAAEFSWMRGEFTGMGNPIWSAPAGYSSWESRKARLKHVVTNDDPVEDQIARGTIIAGTPDEVIPRLQHVLRELRIGTLVLWGADGHVGHADTMECIQLLGREVLPALRETAAELELLSPFEANSPVGVGRGPARLAG
jgi:alkanesulfonate monooxygenase SsuD/methylene tetrahydromethanopterin reductase-like flavin-dependent oxidoreductase (luciferase family)